METSRASAEHPMEGFVYHACMDAAEGPLKTLLAAVCLLLMVFAAGWRQGFKMKCFNSSAADAEPKMASQKQIQFVKNLAKRHNLALTMDPAAMTLQQAFPCSFTVFCNMLQSTAMVITLCKLKLLCFAIDFIGHALDHHHLEDV